ncbi:MAG: hypothetical protein H6Q89_5112, partial [Myxococcaceae bacterium]|nr:hypothetical protein [Myxococcaceae bacterium]
MTDGKKTDVPGAPLDDSVPTETPKLLQQDLGLDRRAPRPVPGFDQLKPLPPALRPDLKATTPFFPSPAKPSAQPPEYANTVISERKDPPSPMDFAKTVPSAANPVLAKIQADERAARERLVAERQLAERTALEKAANERLVADRAATGLRSPAVPAPRAPDPSLLRTDPVRLMSPQAQAARPQPLRQPLASRPLDPTPRGQEVTTDPMPREAVPPAGVQLPAQTVVQRGPGAAAAVPKTDPMQQPDVAAAMARAPAPSNAPLPPSRVAIPPPSPLAPRPPASRPPAPTERTEISRPAPMAGPATQGEIPR